jgi:hypothetical protein
VLDQPDLVTLGMSPCKILVANPLINRNATTEGGPVARKGRSTARFGQFWPQTTISFCDMESLKHFATSIKSEGEPRSGTHTGTIDVTRPTLEER